MVSSENIKIMELSVKFVKGGQNRGFNPNSELTSYLEFIVCEFIIPFGMGKHHVSYYR